MADPKPNTTPRRIGVRAFRGNLDAILREARAGAAFRPPAQAPRVARKPGALRGRIHMAPDFDTLPPDVLAAMYGQEP
jgi:hypothetical protein